MALSPATQFIKRTASAAVNSIVPVSLIAGWADVIFGATAGNGLDGLDAAAITNPTTEITRSTRRIIHRKEGLGTNLVVRAAYPAALSITVAPEIAVFGRCSNDSSDLAQTQSWQRLRTRDGSLSVTLSLEAAKYDTDGTYKYSVPNLDKAFDCQGCDEFLIGTETALTGSGANVHDAKLQAKMF